MRERANNRVLVEEFPVLGVLLRTSCLRHPEFRQFLEVLWEFSGDGPTPFPEILERLSERYPNVYLNVLCSRRGRRRARTLIERGESRRLYEDEAVWKDVVRNNVLFNFLQQLKHMGFVDATTPSHGSAISEYDPDEKPWRIPENWRLNP